MPASKFKYAPYLQHTHGQSMPSTVPSCCLPCGQYSEPLPSVFTTLPPAEAHASAVIAVIVGSFGQEGGFSGGAGGCSGPGCPKGGAEGCETQPSKRKTRVIDAKRTGSFAIATLFREINIIGILSSAADKYSRALH
jgi:hypothetical protein